jgi:hypothetical protein
MEPVSQNPQPEPHEDVTRSWQWRFRDPNWETIWSRWWKARYTWAKDWESLDFAFGGPDARFNPDPSKIPDEQQRASAQEFLDARVAYLAEVNRRDQE